MEELLLAALVGLVSGGVGTWFGVWWQRRDSRAEWLRVMRFDQYVELDRRLRELVLSATRGFELAERAANMQVQARKAEAEAHEYGRQGLDELSRAGFEEAISIYRSVIDVGGPYNEQKSQAQSQLRQIQVDLGRYQLLLSERSIEAVSDLLGLVGTWLAKDPTQAWVQVAQLEAHDDLRDHAATVAKRAERDLQMDQDHVALLRPRVSTAQLDFLKATQDDLRIR